MSEIVPIPPNNITQPGAGDSLVEAWCRALQLRVDAGELAPTTAAAYERGAGKFLTWCSSADMQAGDPDTIRAWKAALLSEGHRATAVNAWLAGVRSLYAWAVDYGRLPYNPAQNVKGASRKGTTKKHSRESLTDLEVRRLLSMPDSTGPGGRRDLAILSLMVYTAVRTVEVHRADLADLRTEGGRLVLDVTGKGHSEADELVVIASTAAQDALYDWLAVRGQAPGPLFTSLSNQNTGERLGLRSLRRLVKHYLQAAGVRGNKTTHSLRHTAITKVIQKSGSPIKAQSVARHKSIDTTMIYFHELDRLTNPGESFIDYGE